MPNPRTVQSAGHTPQDAPSSMALGNEFYDDDCILDLGGTISHQSSRMSPEESYRALLFNTERVAESCVSIEAMRMSLARRGPLVPQNCDEAIDALDALGSAIQQFSRLVDRAGHLPPAMMPFRYPLVIALHSAGDQIRKITFQFAQICVADSSESMARTARRAQEIQRSLQNLVRSGHDITDRAYHLMAVVSSDEILELEVAS